MMRPAIIGLLISLSVSFSALAQDPKLIEQAKKEGGKVIAYGSLESFTVEPIAAAFEKKTGITVEYWRASATKVMDRALGKSALRRNVKQQRSDACAQERGNVHQI